MASKTNAAVRLIDDIHAGWDTSDPYVATAERGLAPVDADALRALCAETGEDYAAAEAEVLTFVRDHLAS